MDVVEMFVEVDSVGRMSVEVVNVSMKSLKLSVEVFPGEGW